MPPIPLQELSDRESALAARESKLAQQHAELADRSASLELAKSRLETDRRQLEQREEALAAAQAEVRQLLGMLSAGMGPINVRLGRPAYAC